MPFEQIQNNDSGSLDNFPSFGNDEAEEEQVASVEEHPVDVNAMFDDIEKDQEENSGNLDSFVPSLPAVVEEAVEEVDSEEVEETPFDWATEAIAETETPSEDSGSLDSFFENVKVPEVQVEEEGGLDEFNNILDQAIAVEEFTSETVEAEVDSSTAMA
jgi:hypothetical protein